VRNSESARVAQAIIDAFGARDTEAFVGHMTEDVVLEPSAFITGRGRYEGHRDILAGFAEMDRKLAGLGEQVMLRGFRHFIEPGNPDVVLTLGFVTIRRSNGEEFGTEIAYLWTLSGGKVCRLRTWLDHAEGLAQLSEPVEAEI
jgi:ketosteroid isomerase-like protein